MQEIRHISTHGKQIRYSCQQDTLKISRIIRKKPHLGAAMHPQIPQFSLFATQVFTELMRGTDVHPEQTLITTSKSNVTLKELKKYAAL
jgi:hypothetical protein